MIAVLDASAFAPIILADEQAAVLPDLKEALAGVGMVVPAHWRLEVANLLLIAARRGRITRADQECAVRTIESVVVEADALTDERMFVATWPLAERHGLSVYDAAYLELAMRRDLPLASHDRMLLSAAEREAVPLFGR